MGKKINETKKEFNGANFCLYEYLFNIKYICTNIRGNKFRLNGN